MSPEVARTLLNYCEVELLERDNARLVSMHTTAQVLACLLAPVPALLLCGGLSVSICSMQTWTTVWWSMCGGCCAEEAPWTDAACLLVSYRRHAAWHDTIA